MFIRLEPSSGVPIKRQIADQLRLLCATGGLAAGDQLPSVRELARELAVNQNTILRVYEQLSAEGLLERRHGDGTYIANGEHAGGSLRDKQVRILAEELKRFARRATQLGFNAGQLKAFIDAALQEGDEGTKGTKQ